MDQQRGLALAVVLILLALGGLLLILKYYSDRHASWQPLPIPALLWRVARHLRYLGVR